jgi:hypothetical protein
MLGPPIFGEAPLTRRQTQLVSKWFGTGRNLRLFWWSGSVALRQLALALIAINAYGQTAFLSSPRELLATDPRAFAHWLDTNRPKTVSADQKAAILSSLPREGEVKPIGAHADTRAFPPAVRGARTRILRS